MNQRIGGVLELLQEDVAVRIAGADLLGLGDGALHALRALRQDQVCAKRFQHLAAFDGHGLRHCECDRVAAR